MNHDFLNALNFTIGTLCLICVWCMPKNKFNNWLLFWAAVNFAAIAIWK